MSRRFGDHYYGEDNSSSMDESYGLSQELQRLIGARSENARYFVEQTIKLWRPKIHARLREVTQLGAKFEKRHADDQKQYGDNKRTEDEHRKWATIVVSDRIPRPMMSLLGELPHAFLWVLVNRQSIIKTRDGLSNICLYHDNLIATFGNTGLKNSKAELDASIQFIESLNEVALQKTNDVINKIIHAEADTLGAYFYRRNRIELYWIAIWLVSSEINVAVEDLALVVLIHEMAHVYTHIGQDADGHCWSTDAFSQTEIEIVEGLAQYYTKKVLETIVENEGNTRPMDAFNLLLEGQSRPYTWFQEWPSSRKQLEMVRNGLVVIRTRDILFEDQFVELLHKIADTLWR